MVKPLGRPSQVAGHWEAPIHVSTHIHHTYHFPTISQGHVLMPRPRVTEELRQRIAKACLYCQATKQKCDGLTPCSSCSKRGRSTSCAYSSHIRSYGVHRRRRSKPSEENHSGQSCAELSTTPSPHDRVPSHLQRSDDAPSQSTSIEVPIPKLSQKVYDTNGRASMS